MANELIIINGKCYNIDYLGWNPKICNPQLKKMIEGKHLTHKYLYVKKDDKKRIAYTSDELQKKYQLGFLDEKFIKILKEEYICYSVEADWNEEFPGSDEIEWDKE